MVRIAILSLLWGFTCLGFCKNPPPMIQVDLILFTHLTPRPPLSIHQSQPKGTESAISLQKMSKTSHLPYHILPATASQLQNEYWGLNRKPQYHILMHQSWLQPSKASKAVAIQNATHNGWIIDGVLSLPQQGNDYILNTALLFSKEDDPAQGFLWSHKQRLKPDVVYYIDHPQAGILLKIHHVH